MRSILLLSCTAAMLALAGCTTINATPYVNSGVQYPASDASRVDVLYSQPQRPYESIGVVSVTRYKPGFTDPNVGDAIPQLRVAAAQVGGDGVIIRSTHTAGDRRYITIEGEAFRYTDKAHATSPGGTPQDCVACGTLGH